MSSHRRSISAKAAPLAALAVLLAAILSRAADEKPKGRIWEKDIQAFEAADKTNPPAKGGIVFIGSSSIRLWDVKKWFPDLPVINRGFGGSQAEDSVHYADRILLPYAPKTVVFYAGDNDIAMGKKPEQVFGDFKALVAKVRAALPETRVIYVTIKPSLSRWALYDKMSEANRLAKEFAATDPKLAWLDCATPMLGADGKPRAELFREDGLHLDEEGYKLWSGLLRPLLEEEPSGKKP